MEKDLLEKLKKQGKIKELNEAFVEFPPEEEWHKGDINSFIKEEKEKYGEYNVGDIVFVEKYTYKNGNEGSRHLFVIIEKDNYAVPIEYFSMLISSHLEKLKFNKNKLLLKDELNNLKRNSIVKTDAIYKITNENIVFKVGEVTKETVQEYLKNLEKLY
ncbi:MAG: type II toxin-antitoxin system PemK/MazF family toxin [Clostridia bacterium]|nr:type II toxin-antitoxin system PemK/MazF family toxin [Clostridia bacterium]